MCFLLKYGSWKLQLELWNTNHKLLNWTLPSGFRCYTENQNHPSLNTSRCLDELWDPTLKLVSAIFFKIVFHQMTAPKFLSSPFFLPVSHCFRVWSKIYLKVYDVIKCLSKLNNTFCLIPLEGKKVWHWNFVHW